MSFTTAERIKALEIALNNESKEKGFYLEHAARTRNALGKLMFASIARDEDEHYQQILGLHKKLINDGKWPETLPIEVKGTEVKAVLKKIVDPGATSSESDMDDVEAVKVAIDFETKGEMFYDKLAKAVDNPMEKKFYEFLAGIEREHRLSLEDTFEYFRDPSSWFRVKEKLNVDGQ